MSLLRNASRRSGGLRRQVKGSSAADKKRILDELRSTVKKIRRCRSLEQVTKVHEELESAKPALFVDNAYLCNSLIEIYGKCGSVEDALDVFDRLEPKNEYTYRFMLRACIDNDRMLDAGRVMEKMPDTCLDVVACTKMVAAYAASGKVVEAKALFDRAVVKDEKNAPLWVAMVACYTHNGHLQHAKKTFAKMPTKNVSSYNTMLAGYVESGQVQEAEKLYNRMPAWGLVAQNRMITGYAQNGYLRKAKLLFEGMEETNLVTHTVMLKGFVKGHCMEEAKKLFAEMPLKHIVLWNIMLHGYAVDGLATEAKSTFDEMPERDVVSWTTLLHFYSEHGDHEMARNMFEKMPGWDVIAGNAMVAAYAQSGQYQESKLLYDSMPERTLSTGNSMLQAFALSGKVDEARQLFDRTRSLNVASWTILLQGYAGFRDIADAKMVFERMPSHDVVAYTTMMLAYAKHHGHLAEAEQLFDKLPQRDVYLWTAMVTAYAQDGQPLSAIETFGKMQLDGFLANEVSFSSVLLACSHVGSVKTGRACFHSMKSDYGIAADQDHYACMVALLGRAGHLDDAEGLMNSMPFFPSDSAWRTLLSVCKQHKDVQRAERAAKRALDTDPSDSAAYVLLSSIYKDKQQQQQEAEQA